LVLKFRLPFPGYEGYFCNDDNISSSSSSSSNNSNNNIDDEDIDEDDIDNNGDDNGDVFRGSRTNSVTSTIKATFFGSGQFITATPKNNDHKNKNKKNGYGAISVSANTVGEVLNHATQNSIDNDNDNNVRHSLQTIGHSQLSSLMHNQQQKPQSMIMTTATNKIKRKNNNKNIPLWMYFFLAVPSVFDLVATTLCMMGLQHVDVSVYQLLRCSGIVFVAWMKQHVLRDRLYRFQWIGVLWNVVSVVLVGTTAMLDGHAMSTPSSGMELGAVAAAAGIGHHNHRQPLWGVTLILSGAIVQAMRFVFEEKVMTIDIPPPPLLLIGMEGLWGSLLCLLVVYPLAYALPGDDNGGSSSSSSSIDISNNDYHSAGSYEDPANTYAMFTSSPHIQTAFAFYLVAIFGFNFFAVMVTYMLDSVWHAILDNFRPISVWLVELFVYYVLLAVANTSSSSSSSSQQQPGFGEDWTRWSWIQVCASAILLYGTAIYNAPNAGSIKLEGKWYSFGFDFTDEYREIDEQRTHMLSSLVRTAKFEFVPQFPSDRTTPSFRYDYEDDEKDHDDVHDDNYDEDDSDRQRQIDDEMQRQHRHHRNDSSNTINTANSSTGNHNGSLYSERSPHVSIHTRAPRGFGSTTI